MGHVFPAELQFGFVAGGVIDCWFCYFDKAETSSRNLDGRVLHHLDDWRESCSRRIACHRTVVEPTNFALHLFVALHAGGNRIIRGSRLHPRILFLAQKHRRGTSRIDIEQQDVVLVGVCGNHVVGHGRAVSNASVRIIVNIGNTTALWMGSGEFPRISRIF